MTATEDEKLLAPIQEVTGTVGDDLRTVHRLSDGKPACGAVGKVCEWQRAVTCPTCLSTE
ncbi:hypothetical protein SEA_HEATHER_55 [Streptomyces phage Heather]|uniref:Uncharacterized protein n=1 Tax=Streptomyces phage Heather TaxID=2562343 RepID=A0A4D6E5M6_9CAUD|nr:hypothetical protein SEA_HEATHER_55 [Streptomyces phage Heather]